MKTPRQIAIADHLWDVFERMARDMGSDRDALVNQAMHVFARQHGYTIPGAPAEPAEPAAPPPPLPREAAARRVLDEAARLEAILEPVTDAAPSAPSLVLVREDGQSQPVTKERFVIGRGRHCDLVIDSTKVSREHAAVVREGGEWILEDLGSSNGTWHRRERVTRKRIVDGDEFFICSEKLRCVVR